MWIVELFIKILVQPKRDKRGRAQKEGENPNAKNKNKIIMKKWEVVRVAVLEWSQ